ncbi:unnamed protein product [Pseudo-nitzschia multistriata]|uniref:ATP-dependent RNA helicase DHX29-like UBA domain-containing protein n=1 Tax=Pseudo-nitzschia multistriata TaxID=183589 RepID=A0A448Z2K0_9STRA|nr:unnamed protein product [Pseudo-nitzschia multistriata]
MGKSKKKKQRSDARGYGNSNNNSNQKCQQPSKHPSAGTSSNDIVVTKQTHEGIKSLVAQIRLADDDVVCDNRVVEIVPASDSVSTSIRFVPKLTKIIDRLIDLGFYYDDGDGAADDIKTKPGNPNIKKARSSYLEQMVVELGYGITLESALDWLCLNVPTLELPPLFTDGNLRNHWMQQDEDEKKGGRNSTSSIEVLKFISSSSSLAKPVPIGKVEENSGTARDVEIEKEQEELQEERRKEQQKQRQIAKEKVEKEEREAVKRRLLEQYAYDDDASEHNNYDEDLGNGFCRREHQNQEGQAQSNDGGSTKDCDKAASLSPQEVELLTKQAELLELEADLGCEANNYMRSKQELKSLKIQVKKLKQQVTGLHRKVENQKRKEQQENKEEEERIQKEARENEKEEEDYCSDIFGGGGFFDQDEKEDEEDEQDQIEITDKGRRLQSLLDCPIPKGWTGTTPKKTLEEVCRKQKLGKPKFLRLGGEGYKLSGIKLQKMRNKKEQSQNEAIVKEEWIALESNFLPGSSLPDYLALQALFEIDSNKPLYGLFPPAFRSIWLSWLEEIQQQSDQLQNEADMKKSARVRKLLALIETRHKPHHSSQHTSTSESASPQNHVATSERNLTTNAKDSNTKDFIEESWEDMDLLDDEDDDHNNNHGQHTMSKSMVITTTESATRKSSNDILPKGSLGDNSG